MKLVIAVLVLLFSSACCVKTEEFVQQKTEVEGVFWHEGCRYSVSILDGNQVRFVEMPKYVTVTVICDVNKGEKQWYEYSYEQGWGNPNGMVYIHIHEEKDIRTGGWNHGKHGSGQTTRIK